MLISYWSADVCASDLRDAAADQARRHASRGSAQGGIRLCRGPRRARRLPAHPHPAAGRLIRAPATRTAIPSTLVSPRKADRGARIRGRARIAERSEEHTSELQSLMRISYAVFCLKKKK